MSEVETETKTLIKDELYTQYDWFHRSFLPSIKIASSEFFSDVFDFQLLSVSKNINILFQGDDYFVTKIRIDKLHDVFFRCSEEAISIILDKVLGKTKQFALANITELEAKIISSFNDYLYGSILKFILPPTQKAQKRKNLDTIHLTFFIRDKEFGGGAKVIISLPQVLLATNGLIRANKEIFDIASFKTSKLDAKIKVGTTKFYLKDLKNLEKEDIVIFEDSNVNLLKLVYKDYEKDFKITPNPGLIISINNDNGGYNMEKNSLSQSLWDDIQIEMGAEFEKVKITLGELKNIDEGLVLDLSSVYENKISLKVEDKTIAKGELVIVNDRYGVRIDEVFASEKNQAEQLQPAEAAADEEQPHENLEEDENSDEEFDYSDFELDDQDI